jgi:hypothetical protein
MEGNNETQPLHSGQRDFLSGPDQRNGSFSVSVQEVRRRSYAFTVGCLLDRLCHIGRRQISPELSPSKGLILRGTIAPSQELSFIQVFVDFP